LPDNTPLWPCPVTSFVFPSAGQNATSVFGTDDKRFEASSFCDDIRKIADIIDNAPIAIIIGLFLRFNPL
jgi:hypothetical protein